MRFPFATLVLAAAILVPYFLQSQGTLYLPNEVISENAFSFNQAGALLSHMFYHVGAYHLLGNLLPLLLFIFLLEQSLSWLDTISLFLFSGFFASAMFSLTNPSSFLVGASAGLSGVMAAVTMLNPSRAIPLLIAAPLITYAAVFPFVTALNQQQAESLASETGALEEQITAFEDAGLTQEAEAARQDLAATEEKVRVVAEGQEREHATHTDLFVHAYGALFAAAYLLAFKKDEVYRGLLEFNSLRAFVRNLFNKSDQNV